MAILCRQFAYSCPTGACVVTMEIWTHSAKESQEGNIHTRTYMEGVYHCLTTKGKSFIYTIKYSKMQLYSCA